MVLGNRVVPSAFATRLQPIILAPWKYRTYRFGPHSLALNSHGTTINKNKVAAVKVANERECRE